MPQIAGTHISQVTPTQLPSAASKENLCGGEQWLFWGPHHPRGVPVPSAGVGPVGAVSTRALCAAAPASTFGAALEPHGAVPGAGGTWLPGPGPHTSRSVRSPGPQSGRLSNHRPRQSCARAGEGFLARRGVQGDGSRHPDGNSTQPQPCTHCISQQRVLHEQGPKMPPKCPILLLPQPTAAPSPAPPRLLGGCKGQALPDMPHNERPQGDHVPAVGSTGVSAPNPFGWPHMCWIT